MPRDRLDVRLPSDLARAIEAYSSENGLDRSSAVRILLRTALGEPCNHAAIREGVAKGLAQIREKLANMVGEITE